jgi:hypothetical protein
MFSHRFNIHGADEFTLRYVRTNALYKQKYIHYTCASFSVCTEDLSSTNHRVIRQKDSVLYLYPPPSHIFSLFISPIYPLLLPSLPLLLFHSFTMPLSSLSFSAISLCRYMGDNVTTWPNSNFKSVMDRLLEKKENLRRVILTSLPAAGLIAQSMNRQEMNNMLRRAGKIYVLNNMHAVMFNLTAVLLTGWVLNIGKFNLTTHLNTIGYHCLVPLLCIDN